MELNYLSAAPLCKAATNITTGRITARQRGTWSGQIQFPVISEQIFLMSKSFIIDLIE